MHARRAPSLAPTSRPRVRPLGERLHITEQGDAVTPDGYCRLLTDVFAGLLERRYDEHDRRKVLRRLREFVAFELVPGEAWDTFLHENDRDGEHRIRKYLESIGCKVDRLNNRLDETYDVTHEHMSYARVAMVAVRQLYTRLCEAGLHRPDSPADVRFWRVMDTGERTRWARARGYHPLYGIKNAGHRFFAQDTQSKTRMLYDPSIAVARLCTAMETVDAPRLVLDLRDVQRVNGLRFSDFADASALGWVRAGLGNHFWCRNKKNGDDLVKTAVLPQRVEERLHERFEDLPHPTDPDLSLMDRLRELATLVARDDEVGRAAADELAGYSLFGRDGANAPYRYHGYRYWLRVASVDGAVAVDTNLGPWLPSSIIFRKAAIAGDVKALFARTADKAEREEGIKAISARFFQRTDQTHVYADWEYHLESIRVQISIATKRDLDTAEERATAPVQVIVPRLALPEARAAWERLKGRPEG